MRLPVIEGTVERRLLVNYRVDPDLAAAVVPPPFRPQLVNGWAVAGICLIRLGHLRPLGWPQRWGLSSENAAHRIAVEWDDAHDDDRPASGVYIPRRDTGSVANALVGGRLFPGEHHRARFTVDEGTGPLRVSFTSMDGTVAADVTAEPTDGLSDSHLFRDVDEASAFFEQGSVGYSATKQGDRLEGLELRTNAWRIEPLQITTVRSTFFDSTNQFPPGTATLDCALLMRNMPVTWHARQPLPLDSAPTNTDPDNARP